MSKLSGKITLEKLATEVAGNSTAIEKLSAATERLSVATESLTAAVSDILAKTDRLEAAVAENAATTERFAIAVAENFVFTRDELRSDFWKETRELRSYMDAKFFAVHNRIDDIVDTRARRDELVAANVRVTRIEGHLGLA